MQDKVSQLSNVLAIDKTWIGQKNVEAFNIR